MGDESMILRAVLDKIVGYATQYQRIPEHECFIAVNDQAISAPWSHVEDTIFTVPLHDLEPDKARDFIRERFSHLTQDGCVMVPYSCPVEGKIKFGLIYYPNVTFMSFDENTDMTQPFESDALVDYLVDIMLVDEVMDN